MNDDLDIYLRIEATYRSLWSLNGPGDKWKIIWDNVHGETSWSLVSNPKINPSKTKQLYVNAEYSNFPFNLWLCLNE